MPKLSVIMSVYNESKDVLEQAIDSILKQTFTDFEFLIVNDNPDNRDIYEFLANKERNDERIILIINENNMGLSASLNRGIKASSSNLIARMDADDISLPNRLEVEYNTLAQTNADIVGSNAIVIDEDDNEIKEFYEKPINNPKEKLLQYNVLIHPSTMFNKTLFEKVGGYREIKYAEDYDLWLRMLEYDPNVDIIEQPLLKYRIRKAGISQSNAVKQFMTSVYVQKKYLQRLKNGNDSFSVEEQKTYIDNNFPDSKDLDYVEDRLGQKNRDGLLQALLKSNFFRSYYMHKVKMALFSKL
ncbi:MULTISPECIES: glycosyltransferase [unclassified Aerococcus]|uniref:glycosyltransferase n=1 Tax=unclassified Aerococcus TaxID=2618060 RepID=UPI0008A613F4|nr:MULTISPECIES: glycosyltransferase [unclassified Aerococcus]MDK6856395.1 glycosyltransferase [Aerococcus sp. UMB7533]OFN05340.1 hypothetical protein HMPREF2626_03470 [Aerococcus sp. HMSC062A02]OHO42777.1 hypothetical protein HMPREF2705_02625 [Aerococcus sp. HMSC035B07]